ncbi:MAG TPA: homoserine dehydrogenase, partial [Actinomycetota bacterium]
MSERTIRIGMLGCGTVGSAVVRMLAEHGDDIAMRAAVRLAVTRVAVRDADRARDVPLPRDVFTTAPASIVADPDIDVVLELLGG